VNHETERLLLRPPFRPDAARPFVPELQRLLYRRMRQTMSDRLPQR
jgi:hypothetical protein